MNSSFVPKNAAVSNLVVNPYLNLNQDQVHNPLDEQVLARNEPGFEVLCGRATIESLPAETVSSLVNRGFLVGSEVDWSHRYRLKYVSLETHSLCNQGCYFCPVSIHQKKRIMMDDRLFDSILDDMCGFEDTLEGVFLNGYNEPTLDRRLFSQLEKFSNRGIRVALNSNGTGLTPQLSDRLARLGNVQFLSINLSTLDREQYRQDRQTDHLPNVMRNVDYLVEKSLFDQMQITVLGDGGEEHERNFSAIVERYGERCFEIKMYMVNDRTGSIPMTVPSNTYHTTLRGCDQTGSRVIEHLHVMASGPMRDLLPGLLRKQHCW